MRNPESNNYSTIEKEGRDLILTPETKGKLEILDGIVTNGKSPEKKIYDQEKGQNEQNKIFDHPKFPGSHTEKIVGANLILAELISKKENLEKIKA